jgi:eukaryotic-like serine/threonine-protein kinase
VIHRDLKPENVLIDRYRRWRLGDFGIASALGEDVAGSSGTPAFAPPEQLLGEAQGPASDCFAFAAIVYFALTAKAPFGDVEGPAILARQLEGKVDFDGIDAPVAEWLRRGLAADADKRFSDATEMQHAWRAVRDAMSRGSTRRGLLRRIFA